MIEPRQSSRNGLLASAYRASNREVVVVLVNLSHSEMHCRLADSQTGDVYITSATKNLQRTTQDLANVRAPARSVSTCILPARLVGELKEVSEREESR